MKRWCLVILLTGLVPAWAEEFSLDDMAEQAQQWVKENVDQDALQALTSGDREQVQKYLARLQQELHGDYVLDLATLKQGALAIMPILEQYEETEPYALWLKARLDYFDVSEELRKAAPVPKPGEPPMRANPTPAKEREIWIKKVATRPWPKEAQPYVGPLKQVFKEQGVSPELIWIAEVESSFKPRARSPAGAVGLFQLMPATAKERGLRTWPFDQRTRTEPAGKAAAQQLKRLYQAFRDWRLAVAAYNAGQGTVQTLLKRKHARTYDEIATALPAETQLYVPRVEATVQKREGVKLASLPGPGA